MHFLFNLLNRMVPIQVLIFDQDEEVPANFDRIITNTNKFVITSRGNFVIAKAY